MLMPHTTMNEHYFAPPTEDEIWSSRKPPIMKSITVAHREHDPPHEKFRLRVPTANAAHAFAPLSPGERIDRLVSDVPTEKVQIIAVAELVFWRVLRHWPRVAYSASTSRSGDGAMRGDEGKSSSAPLTVR